MSLKILFVPFLVIMMLVLGIGYIKPDLDVIQQKKALLIARESQVTNAQTIVSNAGALSNSISSRQESEQFVKRYIPNNKDQDRVIDVINFSATQAGLSIDMMKVEELEQQAPVEEAVVTADTLGLGGAASLADGSTIGIVEQIPPYTAPLPMMYTIEASVRGSYESIKAFMNHVAHADRLQESQLFSVARDEKLADEKSEPGAMLVGTVKMKFPYLASQSVHSALNVPIFQQQKFNFSVVEQAINKGNNVIPMLEKSESGRPNPFR